MQNIGAADYNWTVTKDKFGAIYFGNDDNIVIRYRIEIRSCNNLNKVNI
jgi:hypothetical protein